MGKKIKIKVKKPWIAYPGTPLQQNYAEDLDHGYLLWDIKTASDWNINFKKLPNPKPFVTLTWTGETDDLLKIAKDYPKGTRYRIRSSAHITQKEIQAINSTLYSKGASEITFKSDVVIDRSVVKAGAASLAKSDLRSSDVLLKLVKDHHKNSNFTEETWIKTADSIKKILAIVTSNEEVIRNSKWSLRHLNFNNVFAYGEKNYINFDSINGIVGIFGANRIGKSSIVGTIMYSLFNTTDRGPMKNIHICNIRKPYCSARAIINHSGTDYIIERQTTKSESKKGISATTSLNVYRMKEDGEVDELNGEQRADTEKIIKNLIGSHEDFLMTSLSAQGEINQFISQGSAKRRAILSKFLDLDVFDRMHEIANKEASTSKAQLKNYPDRDWLVLIDQTKNDIEQAKINLKNLNQDVEEKRAEYSRLQSEISKLGPYVTVSKETLDALRQKIGQLQTNHDQSIDQVEKLQQEINEASLKIEKIAGVKDIDDIEDLKKRKEQYRQLETSLLTLKHNFEKEESILEQQKKSLKILDEVPCGDQYPICKFIKDAHVNKEKNFDQINSVKIAKSNLDRAVENLDLISSSGFIDRLEKIEKLIDLEVKLKFEVSKKENEYLKKKSTTDNIFSDLQGARLRLSNLEQSLKNQENIEAISIKEKLENLSKVISDIDSKKMEIASHQGKLNANLEKFVEEKTNRDKILEELKVNEIIVSAFSKKGIPLAVTRSQLPAINAEIAKILQGIVDFSVELENEEDSDTTEIYINYGDSRRIVELCSGMEKTITSLAVRVAMINVSSLPKPDLFIIDEGFGTLDDSAVESCNRLLTSLKRYFKVIIVITHVDGIKDVVDHVLDITKVEKDAQIIFGDLQ
jgi:DNA repair exonuclease SbcCD ATPase subunit